MKISATFEVRNGEVVRQGLEDLSDEYLKVGRLRIHRAIVNARSRIIKPPGKFRGKWAAISEEQRRYVHFLAAKGYTTIPYTRTGTYRKSWKIVKTKEGYALFGGGSWIGKTGMRTGQPATVYIGGDQEGEGQSFLNVGRWTKIRTAIEEASANLPTEIQKDFGPVAGRLGYKWD